jgi:hypothetical protein
VITVQASRSLFPTLYDGAPKAILVGRPFVPWLVSAGPFPVRMFCGIFSKSSNVLQLEEPAASGSPGPLRCLSVPPANVWCVCTGGDDMAVRAAELLIAWWLEVGGITGAPGLWSDPPAVVERRLLDRALAEVAELHRRNEALQRSLSALRDQWASAARIPPEITELLENLRLSPPRMVFGRAAFEGDTPVPLAPGGESGAEPTAVLVQPLPVWSRGFFGIDLHVAEGSPGSGTLLASLYAVDGDRVLAEWQVPFAHLCPGWLPLRVPTALDRPYHALRLRVWCTGADAPSPRLSLAPTGLLHEFAMKIQSGSDFGYSCGALSSSMLSIRLWSGLPGMPWDPQENRAAHPLGGELVFPILDHTVAQVRATREFEPPFRWFGCLPGGKVLLHPLHDRVAAAVIPLPTTSALRAVSCEVVMEDPRRRTPIACKLVVAEPAVTADQAESDEQVLASSGWTILAQPGCPHLVSAPVARPHFGPVNLHLFTRVADGGPDFYGRTVFGRFEFRIDSKAAWQMPPVLASLTKERM